MWKEKSNDCSPVPRVDVWVKSHIRKDGKPVNAAVADTIVSFFNNVIV